MLDDVGELAHVARPVVAHEQVHRIGSDAAFAPGEKAPGELRDVFATIAQRRNRQRDDVDAIQKIAPQRLDADARRRQHARIEADGGSRRSQEHDA